MPTWHWHAYIRKFQGVGGGYLLTRCASVPTSTKPLFYRHIRRHRTGTETFRFCASEKKVLCFAWSDWHRRFR